MNRTRTVKILLVWCLKNLQMISSSYLYEVNAETTFSQQFGSFRFMDECAAFKFSFADIMFCSKFVPTGFLMFLYVSYDGFRCQTSPGLGCGSGGKDPWVVMCHPCEV